MDICLVEDNHSLSKILIKFFQIKNFNVSHYSDGEEAFDLINSNNIKDAYIIDINLPNINGLDIIKRVRHFEFNVPIIIITASVDIQDFEKAFEYGCNDYIKKPFNFKELDIRLNKILNTSFKKIKIVQNLEFFLDSQQLMFNSIEIPLRKKESRFLNILLSSPQQKVTSVELEEYIWEGEIKENYPLRQLVNGLRKKLPIDFIQTDIGTGYSIRKSMT